MAVADTKAVAVAVTVYLAVAVAVAEAKTVRLRVHHDRRLIWPGLVCGRLEVSDC